MKPPSYVAVRYMADFECIGSACEDDCCHEWSIYVDQGHYTKMKRVLSSPADQAIFQGSVLLRPPEQRHARSFAVIKLDEKRTCPFLDPERLCSLHRRFGAEVLSDTCATYPRVVSRVKARVELTGELSCPEVTRRALLHEDATDLIPYEKLGREVIRQQVDVDSPEDAEILDEVRGTMYELVQRVEYPIASRYFFIACLAQAIGPLLERSCELAELQTETDAFAHRHLLDRLHETWRAAPFDGRIVLASATQSLLVRLQSSTPLTFQRLIVELLRSYAGEGIELLDDGKMRISARDLWAAWLQRRPSAVAAMPEGRLELYLQNYAKHFCMRDWSLFAQGLQSHVLNLVWRAAMQRFLLLNHPKLPAASGDAAAVDKLAVEVFYSFARSLDHASRESAPAAAAVAQQPPTLEHCVALLRI